MIIGLGTSDPPRSIRPCIPHEGLVALERRPQGFAKGTVGLGERRTRNTIRLWDLSLIYFSQDVRYLKPHIESVIQEDEERATWDNMTVHRK